MNKEKNKPILFVDMDGTLAVWRYAPLEEVTAKGFFKNLPPQISVVKAVQRLLKNSDVKVAILSSTFEDDHSRAEKSEWLKEYLGEDGYDVFFPAYGKSKIEFVKGLYPEWDMEDLILLDDYSTNLHEWEKAGGTGIKVYNSVNGTKGSWTGYSVHANMVSDKLFNQLEGIIF